MCEEMLNPSTAVVQEELAPLQTGTSGRVLHSPTAPRPWEFGLNNPSSVFDVDRVFSHNYKYSLHKEKPSILLKLEFLM